MGLPGFIKKLFGKGDEVAVAAGQGPVEGVPGAVDTVGIPMAQNPNLSVPAGAATANPAESALPAQPIVEKTA